ncbi:MAG: ABC transporter permease, partial [Calditrichia bacterium]|nr:ABC transporter permease [Calditrichia bacterium]
QFFTETIIINFISIFFAVGFVELSMPFFSGITGIPAEFVIWTQTWLWLTILIMFLVGVFLSGLYPVAAMTSFEPVTVLKGKLGNSAKGISLRKALVVFQFVMALALIIGTITVYQQISFMRSQELGFDVEHTLVVKAPRVRDNSFEEKFRTFKNSLIKQTEINKISFVTEVPGRQIYWDAGGIRKAGEDVSKGKNYQIVGVDYDFADVFDLKFAAGRNFSKEFPSDKNGLVFNETAIKWIGFGSPEEAINQQVDYWGKIFTIIGVLKDYHQQSLKEAYEPHIYRFMPHGRGVRGMFAIKVNAHNIKDAVNFTQTQYAEFFPGNTFDYFFLDDYFDQQYKSDELLGRVFTLFSSLAIIITALGILGLSAFSAAQRTKEIAIRKVLGASISKILILILKDFLVLLTVSFSLISPIMFFGLNNWLGSFAYRMELNSLIFIIPFVLVALITGATVTSMTLRAASTNPVESLQYE